MQAGDACGGMEDGQAAGGGSRNAWKRHTFEEKKKYKREAKRDKRRARAEEERTRINALAPAER